MTETAGRIVIDREVLRELLKLPEGTEIMAVDDSTYLRGVAFSISGPGLPVTEEGCELRPVTAVLERTETGHRFVRYEWI